MDSFLSVCLDQQLRLVNTVAQCVGNVTTEYRFCSSLLVVSWTNEHEFHIPFLHKTCTIAVRLTKL